MVKVSEVNEGDEPQIPAAVQNIFQILLDEIELEPLLECYIDMDDNYLPLPCKHLAGKLVRLISMPDINDEYWDGRVPVYLINNFDLSMIDEATKTHSKSITPFNTCNYTSMNNYEELPEMKSKMSAKNLNTMLTPKMSSGSSVPT